MIPRPRIDLDGVALVDESAPHMVVAIFRQRTAEGLVFQVPESADVLVPWEHVLATTLDLRTGEVRVRLAPEYLARHPWLRDAGTLVGRWTDRLELHADASAQRRA